MTDDDRILADAQIRLWARRVAAGLDPATGRYKRTMVPSSGIVDLVEAAREGKVRLDPGKEPKRDPEGD